MICTKVTISVYEYSLFLVDLSLNKIDLKYSQAMFTGAQRVYANVIPMLLFSIHKHILSN
jgi:multidrug transporter EmrE-like cation transporter